MCCLTFKAYALGEKNISFLIGTSGIDKYIFTTPYIQHDVTIRYKGHRSDSMYFELGYGYSILDIMRINLTFAYSGFKLLIDSMSVTEILHNTIIKKATQLNAPYENQKFDDTIFCYGLLGDVRLFVPSPLMISPFINLAIGIGLNNTGNDILLNDKKILYCVFQR